MDGWVESGTPLFGMSPPEFMTTFLNDLGLYPHEDEELLGFTIIVNTSVDDPHERVLFISDDPSRHIDLIRQALGYLHEYYDDIVRNQ